VNDRELLRRLQEETANGFVREARHGDLAVYKYTQQCVIEGRWNSVTMKARGLVFNLKTGERLTAPFEKFFNLEERPGTRFKYLPKCGYVVHEKLDGSCGIGYYHDGQWKITTPGGLTSDQAVKGMELLQRYNCQPLFEQRELPESLRSDIGSGFKRITPIWEIIYPGLDNILNYGDREELCLLAVFDLDSWTEWSNEDVDELARQCGFPRPQTYLVPRDTLQAPNFPDNFEGWVVRFDNGLRIKIKDPRYVKAHKILTGPTTKRVIEILRDPEMDISTVSQSLSPAFREALDDAVALVQQVYQQIEGAVRSHFNRMMTTEGLNGRKDIALWIQANVPKSLQGCIFGLLDNKDISSTLWKLTEEKLGEEQDA